MTLEFEMTARLLMGYLLEVVQFYLQMPIVSGKKEKHETKNKTKTKTELTSQQLRAI